MAAGTARPGLGRCAISALALPFVSEEQRRAVARAAYGRCVCGGVACGKSHQNWRDMGRCGSTEEEARLFAVPAALVGIAGEPGELMAFCGECLARVQKRHAAQHPAPGTQQELALFDGDGAGA